jgi:cytochrome b involved in lipid metabolism
MRKLLAGFLASLLIGSTIGSGVANAHQPLVLLDTDTSASKGPLIVDGTLSFAVRAAFTKAGQKKAFRAQLKKGEELTVQYLIVDKKPENALRKKSLPALVIISPTGSKVTMKFTERTKFFEPYSRVNYLYLGRYSADAESGIYNFEITSKSKAAITIGVGEKEGVVGEVVRGTYEAPKPVASSTPTPTPAATPTPKAEPAGYTMANVRANNSKGSCWSVINGYVYDLTKWISSHPGGEGAIISLCGKDGTNEFVAQHKGQGKAEARLSGYVLGLLAK